MPLTLESEREHIMIKQRDKIEERVEMRKMKEIRDRRRRGISLVFYLIRMAWLTQMFKLPINHSG